MEVINSTEKTGLNTEEMMFDKDEALHLTLKDGQVRVLILRTTNTAKKMTEIHHPSNTACAALSRLMTGTLMLSLMTKGQEDSVTVTIDGTGPIGKMTAVGNHNHVKVTAEHAQIDVPQRSDGHLDVGALVGKNGKMTVIKDLSLKQPYIGQINLVSGELGMDFAQYYTVSEQTPSLVALGALVHEGTVLSSGGVLVQVLPGCEDKTIDELETRSVFFQDVSRELLYDELEDLAKAWFEGLDMQILAKTPVDYVCDCSRDKMQRALLSLGKDTLQEILTEDKKSVLTCHFCRNEQVFDENDLKNMIENLNNNGEK